MAFASRFLSRSISRQFYGGKAMIQPEQTVLIRSYAQGPPPKAQGPPPPKPLKGDGPPKPLKGDELLKNIFLDVKNKYEIAMSVLRKEKITIDPEDPAAVSHYAKVMKTIREKAGFLSESQRIERNIQIRTQNIPDAKAYLLALQEIRIERGLVDDMGVETMMMDALEKVEKEIKKPLMREDKKGMALLMAEFDKVNQKLGIKKEDLPKIEEKVELGIAKAQLEELKKDAIEAMETQKKREEFKDEVIPDVKTLDIRNFL